MKLNTIKKNREFLTVYKKGKRFVGNYLVLYKNKNKDIDNTADDKRIGITVSKKVGGAVIRNRVRRLIRQAVYEYYDKFKPAHDYVIVARVRANTAGFDEIKKCLSFAINKLG